MFEKLRFNSVLSLFAPKAIPLYNPARHDPATEASVAKLQAAYEEAKVTGKMIQVDSLFLHEGTPVMKPQPLMAIIPPVQPSGNISGVGYGPATDESF